MKRTKRNPQEFDCEQCGNPLYKSRYRDSVRCCWCGYVNMVGKFTGYDGRHRNGRHNSIAGDKESD